MLPDQQEGLLFHLNEFGTPSKIPNPQKTGLPKNTINHEQFNPFFRIKLDNLAQAKSANHVSSFPFAPFLTPPSLSGSPPKRARTDPPVPQWAKDLEENGYAVVPGVLSEQECDNCWAGIKDYFAKMDVDLDQRPVKYPNIHGIVQHLEVGHAQAVWDVRLNAKVQDVFAQMYGTNDLLCSFDGLCVMQPWRKFGKKSWMHFDQGPKLQGRHCVQGYVNIFDSSDSSTGSLYVLPGTHKKHAQFFAEHPAATEKVKSENWYKLSPDEEKWFGTEPVRVHGPRGSLVLWDSRTVHSNRDPDTAEKKTRCVVYTCFQPRRFSTDALIRKKANAFDEYRMTTHWPAEKIKLFGKKWRTFGEPIPEAFFNCPRDRVESTRMLELAGKKMMRAEDVVRTTPALEFAV